MTSEQRQRLEAIAKDASTFGGAADAIRAALTEIDCLKTRTAIERRDNDILLEQNQSLLHQLAAKQAVLDALAIGKKVGTK